ncbi:unnamed protein product [Blepharisma stoltei]|uniref:Uncharacterized protein n=1 Tax=Blepharisma stoltei TaxID=1481888 RepID=A0AAU9IQQ1_9CILI|nr:unnamed protein product [Blepharisma stoltei]
MQKVLEINKNVLPKPIGSPEFFKIKAQNTKRKMSRSSSRKEISNMSPSLKSIKNQGPLKSIPQEMSSNEANSKIPEHFIEIFKSENQAIREEIRKLTLELRSSQNLKQDSSNIAGCQNFYSTSASEEKKSQEESNSLSSQCDEIVVETADARNFHLESKNNMKNKESTFPNMHALKNLQNEIEDLKSALEEKKRKESIDEVQQKIMDLQEQNRKLKEKAFEITQQKIKKIRRENEKLKSKILTLSPVNSNISSPLISVPGSPAKARTYNEDSLRKGFYTPISRDYQRKYSETIEPSLSPSSSFKKLPSICQNSDASPLLRQTYDRSSSLKPLSEASTGFSQSYNSHENSPDEKNKEFRLKAHLISNEIGEENTCEIEDSAEIEDNDRIQVRKEIERLESIKKQALEEKLQLEKEASKRREILREKSIKDMIKMKKLEASKKYEESRRINELLRLEEIRKIAEKTKQKSEEEKKKKENSEYLKFKNQAITKKVQYAAGEWAHV